MKKYHLTILFFLLFSTVYGQTIKGTVLDRDTKESLPFVNISFVFNDSIESITSTDFDGHFETSPKNRGEYIIQFHYTGYEKNQRILLVSDDLEIDLGKIELKSNITELEGVTITAEKESVNMTENGMTFNITDGSGDTMEDIVSSMPSMSVDENGQVSSNGEKVVILVNGVESDLDNPLEDIPMQMIEKVELLNNPPAQYTSASSAINIVLKKNVKLGNLARFELEGGLPEAYKVGLNISRASDRISTSLNVKYQEYYLPFERETERLNYGNNYRENESEYVNGLKHFSGNWTTAYALSPNDRIRLSLSYFSKINTTESNEFELVQNTDENNLNPRENYRKAENTREFSRAQAQLSYNKNFLQKGQKFSSTVRWSLEGFDQLNSNNTDVYNVNSGNWNYQDERFTDRSRPAQNIFVNLNYTHPFNENKGSWTNGIRNNTKIQNIEERFYNVSDEGDEIERGKGLQTTDYLNQKLTFYSQFRYRFDNKLTLNIGGLVENARVVSGVINNENSFKADNNFWIFNPNITLNKRFTKHLFGKVTYSYKMLTPPDHALNPTINDNNPLYISSGNPNLQLQKYNKLTIDVTYHKKKTSLRGGVFFRSINDGVERVFENRGDTIYTTFMNIVDKYTAGVNLYMQYKLSKKQNITVSGDIYKDFFNERTGDYALSQVMFNGKINYNARFKKGFRLRVTGYYLSETILYNGTFQPASGVDLSISKFIYKSKGKIWLSAVDLFSTRKIVRNNVTPTFESSSLIDLPSTFKLGFSWTFLSS